MKIVTIIVIVLMLFLAWVSDQNSRFCALDRHEHIYSVGFLIAALALFAHLL